MIRPLAPYCVALYPVLTIAAANAEEGIDKYDLLSCLVVALLLGFVGSLGARRLTREKGVRVILASLFAVFTLWYGVFVQSISSLWRGDYLTLHSILLPIWIVSFLGFGVGFTKAKRSFKLVPGYLGVFTGVLLVFSIIDLGRRWSPPDPPELGLPLEEAEPRHKAPDHRPDIYFIILDQYTGPRSLRANFGFDLQPFIDSLTSRGFYVPRSSRANYVHTHLSMASILNWTHLDSIAREIGVDSRDRSKTYAMIEYNRAFRFLRTYGYEFVFVPSSYPASWRNRFADSQIPEPFRATINLKVAVLAQTPIAGLITLTCRAIQCEAARRQFPFTPETPERITEKLESLSRIAGTPGPKFVLVHLLSPHEPFVFRRDCSPRSPIWPASGDPDLQSLVQQVYIDQILCLNRLLLRMIDGVLANSAQPPVIVLQSDHGFGRMVLDPLTNRTPPLQELSDRMIAERIDIFAAYHLPHDGNSALYDSITPVNIWPTVLNRYFDAGIKPLEDATFWSNPARPFHLIRIGNERLP